MFMMHYSTSYSDLYDLNIAKVAEVPFLEKSMKQLREHFMPVLLTIAEYVF